MRIAIITESFPPDVNGVAHCVVRVAENLVRKGHHPLVIAPESGRGAADADSQFEYQGATLTREDLAGHIRYLAETGKPVHSILLTTGEKQKIKNEHVAALASICRDLKITGYVRDNDGHLKVIQIVK